MRDTIAKPRLEPEGILIASSHTHAGPAIGVLRHCGSPDDAVVRRLWTQIVAVAKEASEKLSEARLSYAKAKSDLAWNRRHW